MPSKISTTKKKIVVKKKVLSTEPTTTTAAEAPTATTNPSTVHKEEKTEKKTEENIEELIQQYISSMSKEEKQTMEIAKSHLGTSFNIKRSIGYLNWKASHQAT